MTVLPGATLGVLGGGQLGRMFAVAARQMGYRIHVFTPEEESPAGQAADHQITADYHDPTALQQFADGVDVATFEFENIPVPTLRLLAERIPVRPGPDVLDTIQNRLSEKSFLSQHQFPVAKFHAIRTKSDLEAISQTQLPGVLKTASDGYDGKGQRIVNTQHELADAWQQLGQTECVLEALIEFDCEFSVIVARNESETVHYAPVLNHHANHILDISCSPSGLSSDVCDRAVEMARGVADALGLIGVICLEFFLASNGDVMINEIAPRPHNSGHLTIEAHATSQFEQQVRAMCGLPLGSTKQRRPAAMANLLGDLWLEGEPRWDRALKHAELSLHLYGKQSARPGRKMGHLTCLADSLDDARKTAEQARTQLVASAPEIASK